MVPNPIILRALKGYMDADGGELICCVRVPCRRRQASSTAEDGVRTREALSVVRLSDWEERRVSTHDLLAMSQGVLLAVPRRLDESQLLALSTSARNRKQSFRQSHSPSALCTAV